MHKSHLLVNSINMRPLSVLVLTGGSTDSRFDVEKASGTIIIAGALDAERQSNYNLTVEATDGTRSISTQVFFFNSTYQEIAHAFIKLYRLNNGCKDGENDAHLCLALYTHGSAL